MVGHIERMEEIRNVHEVLVWNPEGRRLFGRYRRR